MINEQRPLRPRIAIKQPMPAIIDPLEYKTNKCAVKARQIDSILVNLPVHIWFDKHYIDRIQHGDEYGQREGIETETVKALVIKSMKHLFLYSSFLKNFTFLNHQPTDFRAVRVVLQEAVNETMLNVVIEAHFIDILTYEITVKTAMCKVDYQLSDGQYAVEINGRNSILRKSEKNKIIEIYSF